MHGIVFSDISDHLPIVHMFNTNIFGKNRNICENTETCQRVYSNSKIEAFKNIVKNLSWKEVLNETNDAEKAFNVFMTLFMNLYMHSFHLKENKTKEK